MNYAYGFLEGECRSAINTVGLEPSVGLLHDFSDYQTKQSLVYDLEEPFRWIADVSVVEAFESGALKLRNFYFTGDDYRYRFEVDAKQRFIELLGHRFNQGVTYGGRDLKWDTVIEQKTSELARFLTRKKLSVDFVDPAPRLERKDSCELRAKILALSVPQAKRLGIGKSTLHYLRRNAQSDGRFTVYTPVMNKLSTRRCSKR